jgi:putative nucleotidyltransferase with HDIG domain
MISINVLPILFVFAFSLWSLFIFILRKDFFEMVAIERKFLYVGIFVIFLSLVYLFGVLRYFKGINIPSGIYINIGGSAAVLCMVGIFAYIHSLINSRFHFIAGIVYVAMFIVFSVLGVSMFGLTFEKTLHFFMIFFLSGEIISIIMNIKKRLNIADELVLAVITFLIMISMNILDMIFTEITLIYGIGIISLAVPFYFMIKHKQIREHTENEIITLNEITKKERSSFSSSINMIVNLVESKNVFLKGHSEMVSFLSTLLGTHLGLSYSDLEELETAALLHDIGFVGIPMEEYSHKRIINFEDFEKIKKHPVIGAEILQKSTLFSKYTEYVLFHHECWDGTGYPFGIKGEKIPFFSRIIQIADSYAALTTDRFYRSALSHEDAMVVIKTGKGKEFDPHLVDVFFKCVNMGVK